MGYRDNRAIRGVSVVLVVFLIFLFFLALGLGLWYFVKTQLENLTPAPLPQKTAQESSEDIDKIIKSYVLANSAPEIKDVVIIDKKFFTDSSQTEWLKFNVTPVPENAADPAYGVMKKIDGNWQGVGFGTCCVEQGLSLEVGEGLGFNMDFKNTSPAKNRTYQNAEHNFELQYPEDKTGDERKWEVNEAAGQQAGFASLTYAKLELTKVLKEDEEKIVFSVYDNPDNLSGENWAKDKDYNDDRINSFKNQNADFKILEQKSLKVSNFDSFWVKTEKETDATKKITVYVPNKDKMYIITNYESDQYFEQILASFKFK